MPPLEDGGYLSDSALTFYLGNRARAIWQSKPVTPLDAVAGMEQLVLEVVKARTERAAKTIEHQPTGESGE